MTPFSVGLTTRMYEEAALWVLAPEVGQEALVHLACDALVCGRDSAGLVQLAGQSFSSHNYDFATAVEAALRDLGLTMAARDDAGVQVGAAQAMSRRMLDGQLSPRELARWAHAHIGHSGASELQTLVELDDAYDTAEFVAPTPTDLDQKVRDEAKTLLGDG